MKASEKKEKKVNKQKKTIGGVSMMVEKAKGDVAVGGGKSSAIQMTTSKKGKYRNKQAVHGAVNLDTDICLNTVMCLLVYFIILHINLIIKHILL